MKKHFMSVILFFGFSFVLLNPFTLFAQDKEGKVSDPVIEVKQVEAQKAIVVRFDVPSNKIGSAMGDAYGKLFGFLGTSGIAPAGPVFAVYYSYNPEGNTVFEAGVPLSDSVSGNEEIMFREFPAMKVVMTQYKGPYDAMEPIYTELNKYMSANGLETDGTSWEVYLTNPDQVTDPKDNLTLIYFPLK
jgi:effector-binding domain-containing protein